MSDELYSAANLMDLPEGAVPEYGLILLAYVDDAGRQAFTYGTLGMPNSMQASGLIALAQHDMLHRFQQAE